MNRTMTVDRLIAEAKQNSTGTGDPDTFEPEKIAFALRIALDFLLGSIDYERNQSDGTLSLRAFWPLWWLVRKK